jgi:hypothetical protein
MSSLCRSIQDRLAQHGPTAFQGDAPAQEHLVECEGCYAFLEALSEVDTGLDGLDPIDAPDALVAQTLAAIDAGPTGAATSSIAANSSAQPRRMRFRWPLSRVQTLGSALAATLVLVTSWSVLTRQESFDLARLPSAQAPLEASTQEVPSVEMREDLVGAETGNVEVPLDSVKLRSLRSLGYVIEGETEEARAEETAGESAKGSAKKSAPMPASPTAPVVDDGTLSELAYRQSQSLNQRANEAFGYLGERSFADRFAADRKRNAPVLRGAESQGASLGQPFEAPLSRHAGRDLSLANTPAVVADERNVGGLRSQTDADALAPSDERRSSSKDEAQQAKADTPTPSAAERFANERRRIENLRFQNASGYWENTYVPGDPVMRWLEARLAKSDRRPLQAVSAGAPLRLESAARQTSQAFDAPTSSALSVFLHADQRGLEGEKRMLVQVGLRGADRHSRLRPSMNIGIVLDLRGEITPETASSMRALVQACLAAKDVGDHFSLIAAGKPGGTWVASDEFRHGPITLALARLEGRAGETLPVPTLGLEQAVQHAIEETKRGDDPNAPLGSSLVLLVTAQPLAGSLAPLESIAHRSAVAGVPLSVVGVGDGIALDEIDRLALAGQGNRRLLHAPPGAESLVARELSSLSQVIARALRLRIRLAPGVKLVEVVGSERLDRAGAARVRQAEKSIDRRLARNFGIEADRGEDEEGIQIVIPTFHSGDSHSVVLDVVAPGPGPIMDVTVRYKDLVFLRNGVARANLTVARDTASPGPLERNVVKSYLAIRLSDALKQAGRALLAGQDALAASLVQDFRELIASLSHEVPGYQNDADLATDLAMLDEYLSVLGPGVLAQSEPRRTLADSLQLSGYFKTVPRSPSTEIYTRAEPRR